MPKKLVETIITISILGEDQFEGGLGDIYNAVTFGDYSGHVVSETNREITDLTEIEKLCDEHGTDLSFFDIDHDEEDLNT
jgi:hypothetical protein